jgi:hypothetical protein
VPRNYDYGYDRYGDDHNRHVHRYR